MVVYYQAGALRPRTSIATIILSSDLHVAGAKECPIKAAGNRSKCHVIMTKSRLASMRATRHERRRSLTILLHRLQAIRVAGCRGILQVAYSIGLVQMLADESRLPRQRQTQVKR